MMLWVCVLVCLYVSVWVSDWVSGICAMDASFKHIAHIKVCDIWIVQNWIESKRKKRQETTLKFFNKLVAN